MRSLASCHLSRLIKINWYWNGSLLEIWIKLRFWNCLLCWFSYFLIASSNFGLSWWVIDLRRGKVGCTPLKSYQIHHKLYAELGKCWSSYPGKNSRLIAISRFCFCLQHSIDHFYCYYSKGEAAIIGAAIFCCFLSNLFDTANNKYF